MDVSYRKERIPNPQSFDPILNYEVDVPQNISPSQSQDRPSSLKDISHSNRSVRLKRSLPSLEDPAKTIFSISGTERTSGLAYPWSLQYETSTTRKGCNCQCRCGSKTGFKINDTAKMPSDKSDISPTKLLHMSRAKLKGSASTSELLAGFALVAMVEVNIHNPTKVPEWLFVVFTVTTTILVSVHIFALMISTYILPNMDAIFKVHLRGDVTEAPHESMRVFVDLSWRFSTVFGLLLFLVEVAIICWIQFLDYSFTAALVGSLVVGPLSIVFIAIIYFYKPLEVF